MRIGGNIEEKSQRLGTHKRENGFMILSASLQSLYQKYNCSFTQLTFPYFLSLSNEFFLK